MVLRAIILAGGLGTRLSEETNVRPKPLVEIGGKPILWHIMNLYANGGVNEFIPASGHTGEAIKEYFLGFHALNDIAVDLCNGTSTVHDSWQFDWKVISSGNCKQSACTERYLLK
ncbi:sugar phosphate nucleotidyltransferase [Deinococcus phoenicis]|uniref:sugar phosphate nucleotidyltransferase n=1 Tax=Deinococcus phoenicis TaxID=1476583 RepID=UPI002AA2A770|nr:sugar phosphate nucleotidyltransferase [Deinococcus phoenicis]